MRKRWFVVLALVIGVQLAFIAQLLSGQTDTNVHVLNLTQEFRGYNDTVLDLNYFSVPTSGYDTFIGNNSYYPGTYRVTKNRAGLRNKKNYSREKPDDVFRIGFFGDSFTWGIGVDNTQRWTVLLTERLNDDLQCEETFQGINFGVPGYDTHYAVEMFLQKGRYYDNDLNLFLFTDQDVQLMADIHRTVMEKHKKQVMAEHNLSHPPRRGTELFETVEQRTTAEYQAIVDGMNRGELRERQVGRPFEVLAGAVETPSSVVIVSTELLSTTYTDGGYNPFYARESQEQGFHHVTFRGMGPHLDRYWDHFTFTVGTSDSHLNPVGNRLVADFLFTYLVANDLIDCTPTY